MLTLENVTLVGIDGYKIDRLLFAAKVCRHYCRFADVKLFTHLDCTDPAVVRVPPILDVEAYSQFVIQELHKYVETSHVLIIQHDGFVLNPGAWEKGFLEYDYIGAPFWFGDGSNVGNGGFSLRSKRFLETASQIVNGPPWSPEDLLLCRTYGADLKARDMRFAPEDVARRFALDGNRVRGWVWNGQFGFHNLRTTSLSKWVPPDGLEPPSPWHMLTENWDVQRAIFNHLSGHHRKLQALDRAVNRLESKLDVLLSALASPPSDDEKVL